MGVSARDQCSVSACGCTCKKDASADDCKKAQDAAGQVTPQNCKDAKDSGKNCGDIPGEFPVLAGATCSGQVNGLELLAESVSARDQCSVSACGCTCKKDASADDCKKAQDAAGQVTPQNCKDVKDSGKNCGDIPGEFPILAGATC